MKQNKKSVQVKKLVLNRQDLRNLASEVTGAGGNETNFTETITTIFSQVVSCVKL